MTDHVHDQMLEYIEGALDDDGRARVDAHVATCLECRRELASIATAHRELRAVTWASAPATLGLRAAARARAGRTVAAWLAEAPRAARWIGGSLALAATIALMLLPRWTSQPGATPGAAAADTSARRFVVALYAPAADALPTDSAGLAAWARDYREWGSAMQRDPRLLSSVRLRSDPGRLLRAGVVLASDTSAVWSAQRLVQGFMIVRARNYAEAVAIAQRSPHTRYGGTMTIREAQ